KARPSSYSDALAGASDRRVAAVDQVVAAGDEGGLVREEEADERGDLLGATQTAERMAADQLGTDLRRQVREQGRIDVGRADAVDPQPLGAVLGGRVLGQADDAVLGRSVGGVADRGDGAVDRG